LGLFGVPLTYDRPICHPWWRQGKNKKIQISLAIKLSFMIEMCCLFEVYGTPILRLAPEFIRRRWKLIGKRGNLRAKVLFVIRRSSLMMCVCRKTTLGFMTDPTFSGKQISRFYVSKYPDALCQEWGKRYKLFRLMTQCRKKNLGKWAISPLKYAL
jgi:hypothetical protein